MEKKYRINEIFYSLQFEGARYGTANIFIRFAECNLQCSFCDTEFESYKELTVDEIASQLSNFPCKNIIFTGGEPALQLDSIIINYFKNLGYFLAVETNGSLELPQGLDWITCSPKVAEHVVQKSFPNGVSELKYVRSDGQGIPKPQVQASAYFLSPAFYGNEPSNNNLKHCVKLILENPQWRLTLQGHKLLNLR